MRYNKIVAFIFSTVMLVACTIPEPNIRTDKNIDKAIKKDIQKLVYTVIDGVYNNHPDKLLQVSSDVFKGAIGGDLEGIISLYRSRFRPDDYKILNDFYLPSLVIGNRVLVATGETKLYDYFFTLTPRNDEVFIETGYFNSENEQNLLMTVWGKYDEKWLLNYMYVGLYSIGNRNTVDWYLLSKDDNEKGYYFDAFIKLTLVGKLLEKDALPFFYLKDKEMREYGSQAYSRLMKELKLPLKVSKIKSTPTIFKINPKMDSGVLCPHISYVSSINIKDTLELERECNDLHNIIDSIYKGINKNNSKVLYQVFEKEPIGNIVPVYREFSRVVKK